MSWERLGLSMVLQQFRPPAIERRLLVADVVADALVKNQTANPGSSGVTQLILSDGVGSLIAYHKALAGVDAAQARHYGHDVYSVLVNEAAAWFIARTLGSPYREMVPDTVIRSVWPNSAGAIGGYGALSVGVPGETQRIDPMHDPAVCDPAAFFDTLIGQQDRHSANFRWLPPGRLGLLDNGYAFAAPTGTYLPWASVFAEARHAAGRAPLTADEIATLQRLQAAPPVRTWLEYVLLPEQSQALYSRVDRMLASGQLLPPLKF